MCGSSHTVGEDVSLLKIFWKVVWRWMRSPSMKSKFFPFWLNAVFRNAFQGSVIQVCNNVHIRMVISLQQPVAGRGLNRHLSRTGSCQLQSTVTEESGKSKEECGKRWRTSCLETQERIPQHIHKRCTWHSYFSTHVTVDMWKHLKTAQCSGIAVNILLLLWLPTYWLACHLSHLLPSCFMSSEFALWNFPVRLIQIYFTL